MALFSRSAGPAEAVYARILDGRHLWLAVRGEGPLVLRREGAPDIAVPWSAVDDLLTAVVDLEEPMADVDDDGPLRLMSGSGRRATPVLHAAAPGDPTVTHDRADLVVEALDGEVVVRRRHRPGVEVTGFAATEDGVVVEVATMQERASVVVRDQVLAELPVADGALSLGELPQLDAGTTATFRLGDRPAVRARNVLVRPNYAVLLPPMLEADVDLRWLKDGRLAVHRTEADR